MNINQNNKFGDNIVNIGKPSRVFDHTSQQELKSRIGKNENILIMAVHGDPEASSFAESIKNHLIEDGYKVEGVQYAMWPMPFVGQTVKDIDANGKRGILIGYNG